MRSSDWSSDVCSSDLFPGSIDGSGIDDVSIVERLLKIIHQIMQARIAVRLNHGDHPPLCALASSSEHRPDFHGVMTVIVNDSRLYPGQIAFANVREAPLDADQLGNAVLDRCILHHRKQSTENRTQRCESTKHMKQDV